MAVLVTKGDQVLLLKRRGSHGVGTWCPPGGHLEFGERPEHRAVLEAKEETGVDVTDVRFLSITNDVFPEGKHYITIWMEATPLAGEPAIASEREVADVGWFTWDALPHPLFLSFAHLVEGTSYPAFDLWERHRKRDDASPGQADTPRDTTRANVVDRMAPSCRSVFAWRSCR